MQKQNAIIKTFLSCLVYKTGNVRFLRQNSQWRVSSGKFGISNNEENHWMRGFTIKRLDIKAIR